LVRYSIEIEYRDCALWGKNEEEIQVGGGYRILMIWGKRESKRS
jgi:hypothetical protein